MRRLSNGTERRLLLEKKGHFRVPSVYAISENALSPAQIHLPEFCRTADAAKPRSTPHPPMLPISSVAALFAAQDAEARFEFFFIVLPQ